jgi:hypothetical protein
VSGRQDAARNRGGTRPVCVDAGPQRADVRDGPRAAAVDAASRIGMVLRTLPDVSDPGAAG